ncbi:TetR/AcrR family transcriptional regulator [Ketobacter sp. MCCC 1A13808]|uniref:TetR/AcrR family transcriptional regulator n=1 Tax=Ketobacter sp. MCCC 1A13808 TaxID=2602738 RepID=UPI000F0F3799|nr:TetR/AcrR family transcriptional regulator [Ketobacter sp. MCCC 1A13808]MVF11938.1 TetR/AcrR family transcriptional regulator [Ketobacter sp. MCCC 1A13808]RLP52884.1 MAG: TetR/AcrR family transcriptional regulator [Ketobacter sp.]
MNPEQSNPEQSNPDQPSSSNRSEEVNPIGVAEEGYAPRERGLVRRDLFLDAASDLFSRCGYEAASLQEVVSRAGGSMATLYRLFGNKEGLFQAVIERKSSNLLEVLNLPNIKGEDPHNVLFNVGLNFLNMVLSDEALSLHRILIAESGRNPRLREIFMAVAPERSQRVLGDYLQALVTEGKLDIDDCYLAAIQFINMVKGNYHMRRLLGEEVVVSDAVRRREVTQAVNVFLEGTLV